MVIDEYDRYIPKGFDWHEASKRLASQDTDMVRFWYGVGLPEREVRPLRRSDEAAGEEIEGNDG